MVEVQARTTTQKITAPSPHIPMSPKAVPRPSKAPSPDGAVLAQKEGEQSSPFRCPKEVLKEESFNNSMG